VLALGAVSAGVLLSPLVWRAALAAMRVRVGVPDAARIYLVGQLGKYVPGSVVAFVLQMELARAAGISRARGLTASLLTAGVAVVTSLLVGVLAVPALVGSEPALLWLFLLLPIGLALLHPRPLTWVVDRLLTVLRQGPLPRRLAGGALARATGISLLVYVLYGLQLFVLVSAVRESASPDPWLVLVVCVGTMGVAMTAGLVAFVLPSGIGARELVIVGALAAVLPYGQALALAVVSRVLFTVVELASAGGATLAARLPARRRAPS
jgi:glycosyltransferase 2 family protein